MTNYQSQMKTRLNTIIDSEVLDRVKLKFKNHFKKSLPKKRFEEQKPYLTGQKQIHDENRFKGNIENFYGMSQIPTGLIGPLKVNSVYAQESFHVPMATTEGALVASYNRGAKIITLSGGANVMCVSECMTRSPGFIFENVLEATEFVAWCSENFKELKEVTALTTNHGHLEDFDTKIDGKYVWLIFKFVSGDAAGQNMVTIATELICKHIENFCPIKPKKWYVEANMSGDKKATHYSRILGRGKHVNAEVTISKNLIKKGLHINPVDIVEYAKMAMIGGIHSGSIGVNGHCANALAAIFIACGQDVACVAESSTGTSKAELTERGDLYVSVDLPNLVVGTVGGGTHLPTQREALEIMDCYGKDKSKKFAEICAATVLAGEISIAAAIASGQFTRAHQKYGRNSERSKDLIHKKVKNDTMECAI